MYAVVGCGECTALWIVEGRPESSECPRCGTRRPYARRKQFYTADDVDAVREARAQLLARRQDDEAAFSAVDSFAELEAQVGEACVDDETYLEGKGVDAGAVAEAGEHATAAGGSRSRTETVRAALRQLDEPDDDEVREFCTQRGVPADVVADALAKLVRAGEVTEQDGTYRLL